MKPLSLIWWLTLALLVLGSLWPTSNLDVLRSVLGSLVTLTPLIMLVAALSGWLASSRLADRLRQRLDHRPWHTILLASLIGAVTPVCGIASVPLVAALLRQGVPMAGAMAFWLSSPITDPGMLILTAGILGWPFAFGKLLAAFVLGLVAGAITLGLCHRYPGTRRVRQAPSPGRGDDCHTASRKARFMSEAASTFLLVLRWLAFALTLEAMLRLHLGTAGVDLLARVEGIWAVPLAVAIGGPLYIEGYAALPLLRGLMDMGLSPGAAMALLISGAAISFYSAMAVWSLVRSSIFALYLLLGVSGALVAGWITDMVM